MITYEENNLDQEIIPDPEEAQDEYYSDEEVVEETRVPERWYNAILPLVVLVLISLLRMYFDGKRKLLCEF